MVNGKKIIIFICFVIGLVGVISGSIFVNADYPVGSCIDSDGGLNYYIKGEATYYRSNGYSRQRDICKVGTGYNLIEGYCPYPNDRPRGRPYMCPYGCANDACIYGCIDPDDTKTYMDGSEFTATIVKITNSTGTFNIPDVCYSNTNLKEQMCNKTVSQEPLASTQWTYCNKGCSNGTCAR